MGTPPSVVTEPDDADITYGEDATFEAAGDGDPTPTIQWQVNTGGAWTDIDGATSEELTVTLPTVAMSGYQYRAVFSNAYGAAETLPAGLTVNPKELTVSGSFTANDKVYDGTPDAAIETDSLTLGGVEGDDDVELVPVVAFADKNVGTWEVGLTDASSLSGDHAGNYALSLTGAPTTTADITKAKLTVTANDDSKVYDGTAYSGGNGVTYDGFVGGDDEGDLGGSLNYKGTSQGKKKVGTYRIRPEGLTSDNYDIVFERGWLEITPRSLTLGNFTADSKVYDGTTDVTGTGFDDDRVSGDDLAFTYSAAFEDKNVGTGKTVNYADIAISGGADQGNYSLVSTVGTATADITSASLTVTADNKTRVYGEADPELTYLITDGELMSGDEFEGALAREEGEGVGTYAILQGTLTAGDNYDLTFAGGELEITKRPVEVTANDQSKVYGDADPALTYGITSGSLAFSDVFSGALDREAGETVGAYAIIQGGLTAGENYDLTFVPGVLTITPKAASVTPDPACKVYNETDPVLTGTLEGFLEEDEITATYSRDPGETVPGGPYTISATLGPVGVLGNYDITYNTAEFTISKATATVTLSGLVHAYDGEPKSAMVTVDPPELTVEVTYDGGAEPLSDVGTYSVVATVVDDNYEGEATGNLLIGHLLTMQPPVGNGTVTPSPGSYIYAASEVVDLVATPAENREFLGWTGPVAGEEEPQTTVTMDGHRTVGALFSRGPDVPGREPEPEPEIPEVLAYVAADIDPAEGGSLVLPENRVTLIVPPGATPETTTFSISELDADEIPEIPGTISIGGFVVRLLAEDLDGNPVEDFALPLTIIFHLTDADVGGDWEDLAIMYYHEYLGWIELETTVDPVTGDVSASFDHLTEFGVMRYEPSAVDYGDQLVIMLIGDTRYAADHRLQSLDAAPFIENDRTFVPVRFLAEAFGAEADWRPKDGPVEYVTLTRADISVTIEIGSKLIAVTQGGEVTVVESDVAAFIRDGRTYLPFRAIAEAFGATVDFGPLDGPVKWVKFEQ